MKKPSAAIIKKYQSAIKKNNAKIVTSELLSAEIGVYPEIINDNLAYFDPMIGMDFDFNLRDLLPKMQEFLQNDIKPRTKSVTIKKKENIIYEEINDFIYEKMTSGGFFERRTVLSDSNLRLLKRLISYEQKKRKEKKRNA